MLWLLTAAWLAACGRLGFDAAGDGSHSGLPDAAASADAPAAGADAAPAGPKVMVTGMPAMIAQCGIAPQTYQIMLANPGDQELAITGIDVGATTIEPVVGTLVGSSPAQRAAVGSGSGSPGNAYTVLTALPLYIPANTTGVLQLKPPDSTVGTDRANTNKHATLTLTTNAPGAEAFPLDVVTLVTGANIDVAIVGTTGDVLNLNGTSGNCPANRKISVTNSGTQSVTLQTLASGTSSGLGVEVASGFNGGTLAGGAAATTTFKPFTSSACTVDGGTLIYSGGSASGVCTTDVQITVNLSITGASGSCSC
ncbi:MAG TPA: hypothetical protein VH165_19385 [Kofleriaceae bacterium]|nr:hypothetical protein [Kofleriaceae bacterium]